MSTDASPTPSRRADESSNPLDGVRDLITREGANVFDPSNLGRIDDLLREAGSDVFEKMGPILGEVRVSPGLIRAEPFVAS